MVRSLRRRFISGRGFTLIELMAVVGVLAVLIAMAVPSVQKAVERAREGRAKSELGILRNAIEQYFVVYGKYPANLKDLADTGLVRQYADFRLFKNDWDKWYFYAVDNPGSPQAFALGDPGRNATAPAANAILEADYLGAMPQGLDPISGTQFGGTPFYAWRFDGCSDPAPANCLKKDGSTFWDTSSLNDIRFDTTAQQADIFTE